LRIPQTGSQASAPTKSIAGLVLVIAGEGAGSREVVDGSEPALAHVDAYHLTAGMGMRGSRRSGFAQSKGQ